MSLNIAFCTTCKNRTFHLKQILPQNLADNPRSKFVVLNYGSEDDLVEYVLRTFQAEISSGRLVLYSYPATGSFRIAHAKNIAHRCGLREGADVVVNLDADNFAGPHFEDFIEEQFSQRSDILLWANMIKGEMPRGISGRIAVTRSAFLKTGGYDEIKFNHWGSDDKDFNLRLRRLGYEPVEIPAQYLLALPHNDKIRFREYPHLHHYTEDCFTVNLETITNGVVNAGNIGCVTVYRNSDFGTPITLEPLPTRVFGIGMHKTATTSLHHAFGILGYDSWHWRSAHEAKAIWQEMNNTGQSPTLERFYALCDMPIPLLYRQLDAAYPGSKFILTLRDEKSWLTAVKKHFDPAYNKWQRSWDNDPWSHRLHQILYKRTKFDADVFLARYRRHNAEVFEYFRGRPDLLVMNIDRRNVGWEVLCDFLGRTTPQVPFPYENQTPRRGKENATF